MRIPVFSLLTTRVIRGMGVYQNGTRMDTEELARGDLPGDPEVISALRAIAETAAAREDVFAWVGLSQPTKIELAVVGEVFNLEQLYLDDALNLHQPTKLDPRYDYDFIVMKILTYVESTSDVETGQLSVFIGDSFIITVRLGPLGELDGVRHALEAHPELLSHGPAAVLHAIMDSVVDGYLDVGNEVIRDIEDLEAETFSPQPSDPQRVYRLKRENLELRRAAAPLSRVAEELTRFGQPHLTEVFGPLFGDVRDHLLEVKETTETNDNMLMALLMAATARQDLQQNSDMRKISAWVAIAAMPTMIAGVYGMNFEFMPELHSRWGYPMVLGLMATVCLLMYRAFKRSGWL